MHVLGDAALLFTTDMDGKRLIDDGLSTVMARLELREAHESNEDQTPDGQPWPQSIVTLFED